GGGSSNRAFSKECLAGKSRREGLLGAQYYFDYFGRCEAIEFFLGMERYGSTIWRWWLPQAGGWSFCKTFCSSR
ncbi:MAG: hypothetical protein ACK523_11275, partial [Pirellulaceae bacterium]